MPQKCPVHLDRCPTISSSLRESPNGGLYDSQTFGCGARRIRIRASRKDAVSVEVYDGDGQPVRPATTKLYTWEQRDGGVLLTRSWDGASVFLQPGDDSGVFLAEVATTNADYDDDAYISGYFA